MTKRLIIIGVVLAAGAALLLAVGLVSLHFSDTAAVGSNALIKKSNSGQGAFANDPQSQAALNNANTLLRQAYPEAYQSLEETAARESRASTLDALKNIDQTVAAVDQEALEATRPLLNRIQADQQIRPAEYGRSLTAVLEATHATPVNLDDPAVLQAAANAYRNYANQLMAIVPPPGYEDLHRFWVATTAGKAYAFGALAAGPTPERRLIILRLLDEIVDAEKKAVEALTRTTSS